MKKFFKTLEWVTVLTVAFVGVVCCKAESVSQNRIASFFSNNSCQELEISFLTSDFTFVFTPKRSFVKFLGQNEIEISDINAAKVLPVIDSLKFNYSPSGCELYTTISDKGISTDDGDFIMMIEFGQHMLNKNLIIPVAKHGQLYHYNPTFLRLLHILSDILNGMGKISESHFYDAEFMHPWTQQEFKAMSQHDTIFNNMGENTLQLLPIMNREEFFNTYDVRKLKIERAMGDWHCTITSVTSGGNARFSFPDGTVIKKELTEKVFNQIINVVSQYQLQRHGLLDWVIKSKKKNVSELSNKDLGYFSIVMDKNHGNSTVGRSFLPLVNNEYEYTYRPDFLELLNIIDTWAEEAAMEANL